MPQQIHHLHRSLRWRRQIRADPGGEDGQGLPLRNEPAHRIVQRHQAFLHQHHEGQARDGFGHRIDSENRVLGHRFPPLHIGMTQQRLVDQLTAPGDLNLGAGEQAGGDVFLRQEPIQGRQTGGREA